MPGVIALVCALVCGLAGAGLVAGGVLLADSQHVMERSAKGLVFGVSGCNSRDCSYEVSYTDEHGSSRLARIWAAIGEPGAGSTATVYYQVAHPDVARFPDSDYPNDVGDPLAGFGVILLLCALILAVVGTVRLVVGLRRARRSGLPGMARASGPS